MCIRDRKKTSKKNPSAKKNLLPPPPPEAPAPLLNPKTGLVNTTLINSQNETNNFIRGAFTKESNKVLAKVITADHAKKAKAAASEAIAHMKRVQEFNDAVEAAGQDKSQTTLLQAFGAQEVNVEATKTVARMVATEMQEKFVKKVEEMEASQKKAARGAKVPTAVKAIFEVLIDECVPKRFSTTDTAISSDAIDAAKEAYNANFGNDLFYTVPSLPVGALPHPKYHSIAGLRFYILHWELRVPGIKLDCIKQGCNGILCHDRNEFKKNGRALPLYDMTGQSGWVASMYYKCGTCDVRVPGNHPELLANLPSTYLRELYLSLIHI